VRTATASTLTADEMFTVLDRLRAGTSDCLIGFLKSCEDLQITWEVKKTLIVRMIVGEHKVLPFVVNANGSVDTGYNAGQKELLRDFIEALAKAIPNTVVRDTPKTVYVKKLHEGFVSVWDLLDNEAGCREALELLNASLRRAGGDD
jgi:hypothetical protein